MKKLLIAITVFILTYTSSSVLAEGRDGLWLLNEEKTLSSAMSTNLLEDEKQKIGFYFVLGLLETVEVNGNQLTITDRVCDIERNTLICPNQPDKHGRVVFEGDNLIVNIPEMEVDFVWDKATAVESKFYDLIIDEKHKQIADMLMASNWSVNKELTNNVTTKIFKMQSDDWDVKKDQSVKWIGQVKFLKRKILTGGNTNALLGFQMLDGSQAVYNECIVDLSKSEETDRDYMLPVRCMNALGLVDGIFVQDDESGEPSKLVLSVLKNDLNGNKDQFGLFMQDKFLVFAQQK